MWLLDTTTMRHQHFQVPPKDYAIFSHTWGEDEVTFRDIKKDPEAATRRAGYSKVVNCCQVAKENGFQWVWIDNCCIDKKSSAELSEAINSMWQWYFSASVCFAYLADVPPGGYDPSREDDEFSKSRWFTRGWTLQELLAPKIVVFFAQNWAYIGRKSNKPHPPANFVLSYKRYDTSDRTAVEAHQIFLKKIQQITTIPTHALASFHPKFSGASVAERMSWASRRQTTRPEDIAYSLMGLFDVNMPIIYGEGHEKAFKRLSLEILQSTADQSIFAWKTSRPNADGPFPSSPADFEDCSFCHDWEILSDGMSFDSLAVSVSNIGIIITSLLRSTSNPDIFYAALRCRTSSDELVHIILRRILSVGSGSSYDVYERIHPERLVFVPDNGHHGGGWENVYLLNKASPAYISVARVLHIRP